MTDKHDCSECQCDFSNCDCGKYLEQKTDNDLIATRMDELTTQYCLSDISFVDFFKKINLLSKFKDKKISLKQLNDKW